MRLTEVAEIKASMCKPNMDRLKDFVLSKPTGCWKLRPSKAPDTHKVNG